jgi:biopolymer transport protein ExbD
MAMSSGSGAEGGPMMEINTTPLIDVMLVLLIMFIITLPPPTHAVKIDLPPNCQPNCPPPPPIKPDVNTVYIATNDAVLWNNQPVTLTQLTDLLRESTTLEPVPELHLAPDPNARHERVALVLRATKYAKVTKMGFIGNEAYMNF